MGKCVFVTIGGKEYPMSFSLGAVKRMGEKFGGFKKMESLTTDKTDDLKKLEKKAGKNASDMPDWMKQAVDEAEVEER